MKKLFFMMGALFFVSILFAQTPVITETDPSTLFWDDQQPTVNLQKLNAVRGLDYSNTNFYVKIYVHVLRRADGSGGQSVENVNRMLQILYNDFDPLGIHFVTGRFANINYIDNDNYYSNPNANYQAILNTDNHTNGIDIYLFDDLDSANNGGVVVGVGETTSLLMGGYLFLPSKQYFSPLNRTHFISQFMGKVLYLYNTHFGTNGNPNGCPELVDGSNCTNCGDYICDTSADPNILFNVNPVTCDYTPNPNDNIPDTDANGDPYQPNTSNIMSNSLPSCWTSFSPMQIKRMKNALGYLPQLQSTHLQNYIFIRALNDCFVCNDQTGARTFRVYSNYNLEQLYPIASDNLEVEILGSGSGYFDVLASSTLQGEGESGEFSIIRAGIGNSSGLIEATQYLWVGLPQTVPDATLTGFDTASSNASMFHRLDERLQGIVTYNWELPEPNEVIWGGEPLNADVWQHHGYDTYFLFSSAFAGNQTGKVKVRGENPCGNGGYGFLNEICVVNSNDPEGDTECDPVPYPIIYYPNPANDLLQIDLSLQVYKIYTVVIYDENQTVKYSDQSTNVVKTVDVFNLSNGTYYLHIYDDNNDIILSRILIINH